MLRSLKGQVSSDPDAYRLISSMIDRTQKLVMQFEGVKKHIVSSCLALRFSVISRTGTAADTKKDTA